MSIFTELKRRNVLRVAAAYVAVSWLLIQVVETLFPVFGLSDAAIRTVVILLAIGLIPAVAVAWAFELTPDGLVRDDEVDRASPTIKAATKRLDRMFMIALALAVGYFAFDKFTLDPARDQAIAETAREEGRAEAVQEKKDSGPPVLAVLPFAAVTTTEDSVFFAAGVHDDLLTQLAQQQSMLVVSRTSVLEYRDTEKKIRDIGEELGADVILEGGVQSAGNRIRINAQLIDAKTDEHLWAETYDRELSPSNIFDVQSDIARAIALALHGTFTAAATSAIPTENMAAYRTFHEALAVKETIHGGTTSEEYRDLLRLAFELDPNYTRPMAELVGSLALGSFRRDKPELVAQAEKLLARIKAVAPGSADYLIAQTYYTYYILADYDLAHEIASQALALSPSDTRLVQIRSWIERRQGDYAAVIESNRLAHKLEPRNLDYVMGIITNLIVTHRYDEAWEELEATDRIHYILDRWRTLLRVREHGSLERLADDFEPLNRDFEDPYARFDLWHARLMSRDYVAAEMTLAELPFPDGITASNSQYGVPDKILTELLTRHFLQQDARVAELATAARASREGAEFKRGASGTHLFGIALIAAVEGDTEETIRIIRRWFRDYADQDVPEKALNMDFACQLLGLSGAAEEATACIREALRAPSFAMPFLEPYLPYYDGIRDAPIFIELLRELENQ